MQNRIIATLGALGVVAGSAACLQGSWVSSADPGSAKLTVDGQSQPLQGTLSCVDSGHSSTSILVGSQVNAQVFNDGNVVAVGFNTGALNLQYYKGGYGPGNASASVAGKTYTITGK
jgi:hypothetical protein